MINLLDISKFCEDLPEITSLKIMDKRKFHPDGLFSEQIFGPVKNYTCQCGIYKGISQSGGKCSFCKVDYVNSYERRRRFAKIIIPIPVVNPIFYSLISEIGGKNIKQVLDMCMKNENSIVYNNDGDIGYVATSDKDSIPAGTKCFDGLEAIFEIVNGISTKMSDEGMDGWAFIKSHIDKLFIREIIVLPPDLRPAAKAAEKNAQIVDEINRYYMQILTKKVAIENDFQNATKEKTIFYSYFKQLQYDINELHNHIIAKLSKKEGLIRGNILGKRVDFSGRAVIIPDPSLKIDECSIPYEMFLEIFKLQIAKKLIDLRRFVFINDAVDYVDKCIDDQLFVLFKVCEDLAKDEVCLLNRQPTLHRLGIIGFKIKISLDKIIKIHPLSCHGFNADFDGDQMAVYVPISKESKKEVIDKFMMSKNLNSPSDNSLATVPSQDIVLGIYMLTSNKFPKLHGHVECKGETISIGREIFNKCFPEDFPVVNKVVGKKELILLLNICKDLYSTDIVSEILDNIKGTGFVYSTIYGTTLSLNSCKIENEKTIRDEMYSPNTIREQLGMVSSEKIENRLRKEFKYSDLIESGARGSWDQVRQIVLTRGFISNFDGHILPTPIKNSLITGLTPSEFFNSTYGCRKGLLDVALNTGTSGYLSRKLIFTCINLMLDKNKDDCGTQDLLEVYVKDSKKAKMLTHRWYKNESGALSQINMENFLDIVGKTIYVRSPIFCKDPLVCKRCYGNLWKFFNSKYIGIIAAQALGECNTQLVLRTFHTSGVAVIKDHDSEDMKQMDIVGELSLASQALHKFKDKNYEDIVNELYEIYNRSSNIHHVHFECVVSQLMWVDYLKWRLLPDRDKTPPSYYSVQTVPSYESWLLGLAFSNPKKHIIRGILHGGQYTGIIDKILMGDIQGG